MVWRAVASFDVGGTATTWLPAAEKDARDAEVCRAHGGCWQPASRAGKALQVVQDETRCRSLLHLSAFFLGCCAVRALTGDTSFIQTALADLRVFLAASNLSEADTAALERVTALVADRTSGDLGSGGGAAAEHDADHPAAFLSSGDGGGGGGSGELSGPSGAAAAEAGEQPGEAGEQPGEAGEQPAEQQNAAGQQEAADADSDGGGGGKVVTPVPDPPPADLSLLPPEIAARCAGTAGTWCGKYLMQQSIPTKVRICFRTMCYWHSRWLQSRMPSMLTPAPAPAGSKPEPAWVSVCMVAVFGHQQSRAACIRP